MISDFNKMASIEHVIDVDNYEIESNFFAHDQVEEAVDNNNYSEDCQTLGVEIIDYGICEEEEEVCEAFIDKHPAQLELPQEKSQGGPSEIAPDMLSSCKTKRALVKVVDCEAFPWYYPKYKNQILKRKYQNAVEHARSIMKCLKDCLAEENAIVNVHEISDSENDSEKYQKTATEKTIDVEKQVDHKEYEPGNKESQKHSFTGMETQCTNYTFDIKKNTGLIGIKVQTKSTKKNINHTVKDDKSKKSKKLKHQHDIRYKTSNLNEPERENICLISTEKIKLIHTEVLNDSKNDKLPVTDRSISTPPATGNTIYKICNVVDNKKFKPMPKSKKSALVQQQLNQDKCDSNKNTKFVKCTKVSRNHITAPKNNFPVINQLTRKILKKLDRSLNYSEKNKTNRDKTTIQKTPNILGKSKELTMTNCNNEIRTNESSVTSGSLEIKRNNTEYPIATSTAAFSAIDRTFLQHKNHQDIDSKNNDRGNSIPSNMTSNISAHRLNRLSTDLTNVSNEDSEGEKTFTSDLLNLVANQRHKITAQRPTNKIIYNDQNVCGNIQHHIKDSIISTSQNDKSSSETQEYIVPDFINSSQIPSNTYNNTNTSPPDLGTKNCITYSSDRPLFGSVQNSTSLPQLMNTAQNARGEFINIAITHQPDRNANNIQIKSQIPVTIGPNVPAVKDASMRPNLLKRSPQANRSNCEPRFQNTSSNMPAMPQYNISPPNYARPPSLNVPPWVVNQYQYPNYRYSNPNFRYPPSTNVQKMLRNAFNQQPMFIHNFQNGYRQPMWITSYKNMSHEAPKPPGICNIAPKNDHFAFNQCPPLHTRMSKIPPLPLPQCTSDKTSSIIGKNNNELVKKIHIQIPTVTNMESKNNKEQEIIKDMNANKISMANKLSVGSAASVYTHAKPNQEKEKNEIVKFLNNLPAITKTEMLKDLEKVITNITDDKKGGSLKVPSSLDSQVHKQLQQTEPRLVKQLPLPKTSKIQSDYLQKQKQDLKRPFSALPTPELSKSHMVVHKPEATKHTSETLMRQKIQNLPQNVIEAIIKNIPLTEEQKKIVAESQATTLNNHLKTPICEDSRAKKLNNLGTYKPGPLSKRIKPADILTTPPRDSKKIPIGNGYSPPILPIPTFHNFLSDLNECRDSCKATEAENFTSIAPENKSREKKKTPKVKSILRNKTIKTPEVPEKSQTKKMSIEEYNKRSLKDQLQKKRRHQSVNKLK